MSHGKLSISGAGNCNPLNKEEREFMGTTIPFTTRYLYAALLEVLSAHTCPVVSYPSTQKLPSLAATSIANLPVLLVLRAGQSVLGFLPYNLFSCCRLLF